MDVIALQGDTVDSLCWRHYRQTAGITERVLELNPGLASIGPILPEGHWVTLPDQAPAPVNKPLIQLWD